MIMCHQSRMQNETGIRFTSLERKHILRPLGESLNLSRWAWYKWNLWHQICVLGPDSAHHKTFFLLPPPCFSTVTRWFANFPLSPTTLFHGIQYKPRSVALMKPNSLQLRHLMAPKFVYSGRKSLPTCRC